MIFEVMFTKGADNLQIVTGLYDEIKLTFICKNSLQGDFHHLIRLEP